jgi:hypothetical protein
MASCDAEKPVAVPISGPGEFNTTCTFCDLARTAAHRIQPSQPTGAHRAPFRVLAGVTCSNRATSQSQKACFWKALLCWLLPDLRLELEPQRFRCCLSATLFLGNLSGLVLVAATASTFSSAALRSASLLQLFFTGVSSPG